MDTDQLHLVVEGTATPVNDPALPRHVADAYQAQHGWNVDVQDGSLHTDEGGAPTAGPPPWRVWRITPQQASPPTAHSLQWTF